MLGKIYSWFKGLSLIAKTGVITSALFIGGVAANPAPSPSVENPAAAPATAQTDKIETKSLTVNEDIPFSVEESNNASLAKGSTSVTREGSNGTKEITYQVTYKNGVEQSRIKLSEKITKVPVNKLVAIGTYEAPVLNCPNGTYVNTYGNEVCSPYQSSSAPEGATAKCVDGTYSFSQTRSGTCSHHGGVAQWL